MRSELTIASEYDSKLWDVNHNPAEMLFSDFNGHVNFLKESLLQKLTVVNNDINEM